MRQQLELREHGLAEVAGAQPFQHLAEHKDFLLRRLRDLQHVVGQQHLVGGGRNLGQEQRVAGRLIGLRTLRQHRVHAVSPLVRKGHQALEGVGVVEKDIGRLAVDAGGIGTVPLARLRPDVHGAGRQRQLELVLVLVAQRLHRGQRDGRTLIQRIAALRGHQVGVDVVVVQVRQLEHLLPQLEVAVQRGQRGVGLGHQRAQHLLRHLDAEQRRRCRRGVLAQPRIDHALVHTLRQQRAQRVLELAVSLPEAVEDLLAHSAVRVLAPLGVPGVGDLHRLAVHHQRGPVDVGVDQQLACVGKAAQHRRQGGQRGFDIGRQCVRRLAQRVAQRLGMFLQARLGSLEGSDLVGAQRLDLRVQPGHRAAVLAPQAKHLAGALLVAAVGVVGAGLGAGVDPQPRQSQAGGGQLVQRGAHRRRILAQAAAQITQLGDLGGEGQALGVPGSVGGEQARQVPHHARVGAGGLRRLGKRGLGGQSQHQAGDAKKGCHRGVLRC